MSLASLDRRMLQPFERLFDALVDPARRARTMALLLIAYAAAWTIYGVIAKGSQDIHFDMGEMVVWARETFLTTPNHPPLGSLLVRLWFAVFPLADWSYYLFAILFPAAALWFAWKIAAHYLDPAKAVVAVALLTFVPFFNFHAFRYGATTVLLPFWAATTWWFLRSFETRRLDYAALAGLAAAASMLGKYWSAVLLIGLGIAVLCDPRRGAYFRSAAPWVTVAAGIAGLAPHAIALATVESTAVGFAFAKYAALDRWDALLSGLGYVAALMGYAAGPFIIAALATRPTLAAVRDTWWPRDADRRLLSVAFVAPLILAIVVVLIFKVRIVSVWGMAGLSLLPVLLLASPLVTLPRMAAVRVLAGAVLFPLIAIVLSPVIAIAIHRDGPQQLAAHYRQVAEETNRRWRAATGQPLRVVASGLHTLYGMSFYFPDRPSAYLIGDPRQTPWVNEARIAREGMAVVCAAADADCLTHLQRAARSMGGTRSEFTSVRRHFGVDGKPERFVILLVSPRP